MNNKTLDKAGKPKINKAGRPKKNATSGKQSKNQFYSIKLSENNQWLVKIDYTQEPQRAPKRPPKKNKVLDSVTIAGKQYSMKLEKWTPEDQWAPARFAFELRRKAMPNEIIQMPSEECLKQLALEVMKRMKKLYLRVKRRPMKNSGDLEKTEIISARNQIDEIIKNCCNKMMRKMEDERWNLDISGSMPIYIEKSQHSGKTKYVPHTTAKHEYVQQNKMKNGEHMPSLENLKKIEEDLDLTCKCKNGKCGSQCPCAAINRNFTDGRLIDPNGRRHYSCTKGCSCGGKCAVSFPEPPPNGVEVGLHPVNVKGFSTFSRQLFHQGETVLEMNGETRDPENTRSNDEYVIDYFDGPDEMPHGAQEVFFERLQSFPTFEDIKKDNYMDALKEVFDQKVGLDPRDRSNQGRFISSSCFANTKVNVVYSRGLNPLNARILFTSTMPIFPNMEVTFSYSTEYIVQQLKDICECGSLCCVKNVDLFPFIKEEDVIKFYRKVYEKAFGDYKKHVLDVVLAEENRE